MHPCAVACHTVNLQVDYSKSLELDPDNVKTLNNRGYSYAKSGQYAAAVVRLQSSVSIMMHFYARCCRLLVQSSRFSPDPRTLRLASALLITTVTTMLFFLTVSLPAGGLQPRHCVGPYQRARVPQPRHQPRQERRVRVGRR